MFDRLRKMLGIESPDDGAPSGPASGSVHEEQEHMQQEQFDAWAGTLREVERVEKLARKSVPVKHR